MNSQLTPHDEALIKEATEQMSARTQRFYDFHGFKTDDIEDAKTMLKHFQEQDMNRMDGFPLWHTPLAMKAFIAGFILAKRCL
jgi:hypothetical protein